MYVGTFKSVELAGLGQSVPGTLDEEEHQEMEHEILNLLGLPEQKLDHRDYNVSHTVPMFMLDIYNALTDPGEGELVEYDVAGSLERSKFQIGGDDVRAINESDIIMSFVNFGRQADMQWTQMFWFDTSSLPGRSGMEVIAAELRLFKQAVPGELDFRIKIHRLVESGSGELLDEVKSTSGDQRWIIADVTAAVDAWQSDPSSNAGLMMEIEAVGGDPLRPEEVGMVSNRHAEADQESFMVVYLKSHEDIVRKNYPSRTKRSPRKNKSKRKKKKYSYVEEDFSYSDPYIDYYSGSGRERMCQKRSLFVSFKDLGWEVSTRQLKLICTHRARIHLLQDWIIAPSGYSAYYCHGDCNFPLNTLMNATNHAIVQTLVHLMNPGKIPRPGCAPTKLSGISVLYYADNSNVIMKKYRNMVIKHCGCH